MSRTRSRRATRKPAHSGEIHAVELAGMRLHRFLATAGVDSRRKCEQLIRQGRVSVDGMLVTDLATVVDPEQQKIQLDGEIVRAQPKKYFLLNKPKGFLCTNRDPQGRPRAVDLVPSRGLRLFTVGRLDENSQGLLLVTNDGELANRFAHPRYRIPRVYRVQVAGIPKQADLVNLRRGFRFDEGWFRFRSVRRMKSRGRSSFLEVELLEGRNREIRRLFARVGHKVMQLERVAFGPLKLGHLATGKSRLLRPSEVRSLHELLTETTDPLRSPSLRRLRRRNAASRA